MEKTVRLSSSDGTVCRIPRDCVKQSALLDTIINDLKLDDDDESKVIPLPKINSSILKKVVLYLEHHRHDIAPADQNVEKGNEEIGAWDTAFLKVDQATLFELIMAANYMDIKGLLDASCKAVATMIRGKCPDEIRRTFNIKNDFSPDEENLIRKENAWCED
ncbi:unnamed protein product [Auanema sp. JU1783]|nr:unnamed protein product [Auanema sp. JU1783]